MKKVIMIIQARMGSTRLPGKVMMDLCGKPVLWHVLQRVKQAKLVDDVIVATSTLETDDKISDYLKSIGTKCFRGDEKDVLSRYYHTAKKYRAKSVVRITSDCPLIDPEIIDKVILKFLTDKCEYASNIGENRTYPRGLDCEIFSFNLLKKAYKNATEGYEREHVTPFMYWKQDSIVNVENYNDYSDMRWTLDTKEDFEMIQEVYKNFYKGIHDFYMEEVYAFIKDNPIIYEINHNIKQKSVK